MPDIVQLSVGGKAFSGWESVSITRSLDNCADAFSLAAPFQPKNADLQKAFKPYSYQEATVKIDDELLLTGPIEVVSASVSASDRLLNVQGRSKTGVLVDCSIDGVGYQFSGMSLLSVAQRLTKPYGITVVSLAGSGPGFKTAKGSSTIAEAKKALKEANAEPGSSVFEFLNKHAQDAGLLLTCDASGQLIITKINPTSAPVAAIIEGSSPVSSIEASYDGTKRYSLYKVLQQQDGTPSIKGSATDSAIKVYRPLVQTGAEGDAADIKSTASWRRALAIANSISVSVTVSGWCPESGSVWCPGSVVTLLAPSVFLAKETPFVIAEATLTLDASQGRTTSLRLVLPATYSGETPKEYPWD